MAISPSNGQDFSLHQWKDRLVVIRTSNPSSYLFKEQLKELGNNPEGLRERKIVIYQSVAGKYKIGLGESKEWKKAGEDLEKLQGPTFEFEVILMGLDGGVKLRTKELLSLESLFRTIDQMPMRMSEIQRKKEDNQRR